MLAQFPVDLFMFTKEALTGKLCFLGIGSEILGIS